jgi:mannose-6-phosphate isomerase-like protein (cupin superfamily)
MSDLEACRGKAVVVQPGEGPSYWQPKPANGFADPTLVPADTGFGGFSMGYQNIAPKSRIRAHSHRDQVELQICFSGRGHVEVDGERHELVPGTACFLGPDVVHEIFNDGEADLVQLWVIGPAGLEDFFRSIGRPRQKGEAAPKHFERPGDVAAIERAMGFDATKAE